MWLDYKQAKVYYCACLLLGVGPSCPYGMVGEVLLPAVKMERQVTSQAVIQHSMIYESMMSEKLFTIQHSFMIRILGANY
jgi:hypothetical protein